MTNQEIFKTILEIYSVRPDVLKVYLSDITCVSGRVLKSKNEFFIHTSTSLFRIPLEEVTRIEDENRNKIMLEKISRDVELIDDSKLSTKKIR